MTQLTAPIAFDAGPALVALDPANYRRVTVLDLPTDGLDLDEAEQLRDALDAALRRARRASQGEVK